MSGSKIKSNQSVASVSCYKRELKKLVHSRNLSTEESKRLKKLEAIAAKLKRGENLQNRQLQTWLSVEEYEQFQHEWQQQLELRGEL